MAVNTTKFKVHVARAITDLPVTFTFANASYTGVRAELSGVDQLIEGGFQDQSTIELHVPVFKLVAGAWIANFPVEPVMGNPIGIEGKTLEVLRVGRSADASELILSLGPPST